MCGIVGILAKGSNGFQHDQLNAFHDMLYADALRGMDSTGVFSVHRNNDVRVAKQAAEPGVFQRTKMYNRWSDRAFKDGMILVGHNRKATKGAITSENAHPFTEGKITLVHNGFLPDHEKHAQTEVDSHALAHVLDKGGMQDLVDAFGYSGAFALTWYNRDARKLLMVRNNDRPMCVVDSDNVVLFGSEMDMIVWCAWRNRLTIKSRSVLKAGAIMSYSLDKRTVEMEGELPPKKAFMSNYPSTTTYHSGPYMSESCEAEACDAQDDYKDDIRRLQERMLLEDKLPKTSSGETLNEKQLHDMYREPCVLSFRASKIVQMGPKHVILHGVGMYPGAVPVKCMMHITDATKPWYDRAHSMVGHWYEVNSRSVSFKDKVCHVHVSPPVNNPGMMRTFDQEVFQSEWNRIVQNVKCTECDTQIKTLNADTTIVDRVPDQGGYRVYCTDCVVKTQIFKERKKNAS